MSRPDDSERIKAHGQLMAIIRSSADEGRSVPCEAGLLWTTDHQDDEDRGYAERSAVRQCRACHLLAECRRYVVAFPEPAGIWAGMTPAQQRRAHRAVES